MATAALTAAEFAALMAPLGPFGAHPRVAMGVSGGPHSLALALLSHDWASARGGSAIALIADHGLRPESGAEAEGVAAQLAALGIEARVLRLGLPGGSGLQERARIARRAALLTAAAGLGAPWLLLGHHRGDQAETLAFRVLRGSGPAGLAGMAPLMVQAEGLVLRPLLDVPPARLEALLAERGVVPVRDPSNDNPRFARVRLRQAMADPEGTGTGTAALAEAAAAFARRAARSRQALAEALLTLARPHPLGAVRIEGRPEGVAGEEAMAALIRMVSGAVHPPPREGLRRLISQGEGTLHGALWAGPWLMREPAAVAPPQPARDGAVWDGRWRLSAPAGLLPGDLWGALGEAASDHRALAEGLPLALLRSLPALWRGGVPVAIPALGWAAEAPLAVIGCHFAPASGPLLPLSPAGEA
ncbi:tRNA lysidine(34) synthetase TilS [Acetobacteraceae bacterium H6797]|nr:tRNA lysidine(34) synthetase TilS [Acetobacteraceae bacterium H6797]